MCPAPKISAPTPQSAAKSRKRRSRSSRENFMRSFGWSLLVTTPMGDDHRRDARDRAGDRRAQGGTAGSGRAEVVHRKNGRDGDAGRNDDHEQDSHRIFGSDRKSVV